jgi:biopolymer transport protein TolR
MAIGGPSREGGMLAEINVTPLVDVMLVLLIIFMVTAPMIQQGVDVNVPLPTAAANNIDDDDQILILTVTKKADPSQDIDTIYLGHTPVALADLSAKIQANPKLQADKQLYIHADRNIAYGQVVDVMAEVEHGGVTSVGLITDPLGAAVQ